MNKRALILLVLLLAAAGAAFYWFSHRTLQHTDDAAIEAHVIPMISKVPGYVTKLHIDDNQKVAAGDILLEIDPRDYQIARDRASAALSSANATLQNTSINLKRQQSLTTLARSRKDLEDAQETASTAEAAVATATAQLAQADKDLKDTILTAPEDGIIANRGVEAGAYVTPGQQLFSIVTPQRWIVANFKETQIKSMRPGQAVDVEVDAYPALKLHGKIDSIQHGTGARFALFPPQNATGNFVKIVQRVPVKITLDGNVPADVVLGPGLSVVPTVHTN